MEVSINDINNPYVASFGTFGIGFLLEGNYNKKNEEITITNIWENINDGFDFKDDKWWSFLLSQPLGVWGNSIFMTSEEVGSLKNFDPLDNRLNVSNNIFYSFRTKTQIGKDYRIVGKRKIENNFIQHIKINKNDVQYK